MIRIELDHASVAFTTRKGGSSAAPFDSLNLGLFTGDDEEVVRGNLELVRAELGVECLHLTRQMHGSVLHSVEKPPLAELPAADGMITALSRQGLLVTGADCPPVAIAGPERLAMLHCGWKPLAAGIVEAAIGHLGGGPLQAAIGPGISQRNYEVGQEVVDQLGAEGAASFQNGKLSLAAIIEAKLRRAGVQRVETVSQCTYADADEYFSYRRDGAPTGRQAGIAWRS
jgi:YfiH family protein